MKYDEYMKQIDEKGYKLSRGIFRDSKNKPKCFNPVFQDLVIRQKNGEVLSEREYNLYGYLIMSLVQIVLNNAHFRYQEPDIKEECRTEAYCGVLEGLVTYFDEKRGSTAYSYAFRICYTSMIHVLERMNQRNNLDLTIEEMYNDYSLDCGHKVNTNIDYDN